MRDLYRLIRPALMKIDAEQAHRLTLRLLNSPLAGLLGGDTAETPDLETTFLGIRLPNPIGLAAGFDKNAQVPDAMLRLGFGFVEIGTVTPRPQAGNPPPRIFRLVEDEAVINRIGFANEGADIVTRRLSERRAASRMGKIGINIGANKDSEDWVGDYVNGLQRFSGLGDYYTINISSPNTPGLRALQTRESLKPLMDALIATREHMSRVRKPPLLVKLAPDLSAPQLEDIAALALEHDIDGLIISNTTIGRPESLHSPHRSEAGGLSGAPLKALALETLQRMYRLTGGTVPLIGVGGISSGQDVYDRIRAGASVVQLYSALVYEGPGLVRRIKGELSALLKRDGFATVSDAVGKN
ncbi:quinone-dependent dihydroorotate dehydrogenase [Emcibacter sp. SYSU 3D8]|uniref:quinone-dependent dihydroorotate dehydrogenase n=1 Tax=Emcibacter sp. SYSU 3D8 TaxID=3133969 RepID=UPI0031FE6415